MRNPFRGGWMASRRLIRSVEALAAETKRVADALDRIADRVDPHLPDASEADLRQTEAATANDAEQAKIQDYAASVYASTGRLPTDDEIVRFLEGAPV